MQSVENVTFWKLEYFFLCIIRLFVFVFGAFFFFFSFKCWGWGWVVGVGGYVCLALCVWKCWVQANLHTKTKKWWPDFRCRFGVCVWASGWVSECMCVCEQVVEWVSACVCRCCHLLPFKCSLEQYFSTKCNTFSRNVFFKYHWCCWRAIPLTCLGISFQTTVPL